MYVRRRAPLLTYRADGVAFQKPEPVRQRSFIRPYSRLLTTNGKPIAILPGIEEDELEETAHAIRQAKHMWRSLGCANTRSTAMCRSRVGFGLTRKFAPFAPGARRHEGRD